MNKMVQMEVGVVTYLLGIKIGHSHVTSDPILLAFISEEGSCSHITTPHSLLGALQEVLMITRSQRHLQLLDQIVAGEPQRWPVASSGCQH